MDNPFSPAEIARLREQHYNATVSRFHLLHDVLAVIHVKPDSPIHSYKPGQYTTLGLGNWEPRVPGCQEEHVEPGHWKKLIKRAYSISCPILSGDGELLRPEDEDFLEFYVVLMRDAEKRPPALTPRLFALEVGSRLWVSDKITGSYTLDRVKPTDTVIFMATGTGEAPHNKMTLELLRNGHQGVIASVVCVRYQADLGYFDTHQKLVARFSNYHYLALTTREKRNQTQKRYIQDLITSGELEQQIGRKLDSATAHVFLCGNPKMIGVPEKSRDGTAVYPQPTGVVELLERRGFSVDLPRQAGNIHFEKYW